MEPFCCPRVHCQLPADDATIALREEWQRLATWSLLWQAALPQPLVNVWEVRCAFTCWLKAFLHQAPHQGLPEVKWTPSTVTLWNTVQIVLIAASLKLVTNVRLAPTSPNAITKSVHMAQKSSVYVAVVLLGRRVQSRGIPLPWFCLWILYNWVFEARFCSPQLSGSHQMGVEWRHSLSHF